MEMIRPFGEIFRPGSDESHSGSDMVVVGYDGFEAPEAHDSDTRSPRTSFSFRPSDVRPVSIQGRTTREIRFVDAFRASLNGNIRTKPSYTDCWLTGGGDSLRVLASYGTGSCDVSVGVSDDGETEYRVMPKEYSYPESLNSVVSAIIDSIRDEYREKGGSIGRESVVGMARAMVPEFYDDIEASCERDADGVAEEICDIAYRYTVGPGIFEVLLTDPHIEDVYIDAPCESNRIHVTMNGIEGLNSHIRCRTNLTVDRREVMNLINILRRESGLRFCRSNPIMETDFREFDARATVIGYPLSPNGDAVAIRKHSSKPWTLSRLVANGTVDPETAGLLSFLVNNRSTVLLCGARGAGKSSLLSAMMFEFPLEQRILTIEDTIELPGESMRRLGYKVQTILVDDRMQGDQASRSDEALRVSLRMGESAIVLGEVRGEEARTLYQSMRTGKAGSSIMGTVHGDSASSVYRRMVHDIGIPSDAFMATDVIVTVGTVRDRRTGHSIRRIEEIVSTCDNPGEFADISDPEAMFDTNVMRRALRSSQMGRRDVLRDIRTRSAMRSMLAEAGRGDERFFGPEWIITANEILSRCSRESNVERAVGMLRERIAEVNGNGKGV